jgi:NADP-dependent 3-hydroxy acid dehydrogenase YdfG
MSNTLQINSTKPKIVLITGASSGIGKATAIKFVQDKNFKVYVTSRKINKLEELQNLGCIPIQLDVTEEQSRLSAITKICNEVGGVDILINNAGYGQNGVLEELEIESIKRQFDTNVFGLIGMCQLVLPNMRDKKSGRIINIGSVGGEFTTPGASAYHASKYALESFTDGLRGELKQFGIQVSLIKPGGVRTNFVDFANSVYPKAIEGNPYSEFRTKFNAMTAKIFDPKNKIYGVLKPEEVANVIHEAATVDNPKTRYRIGLVSVITPIMRRLVSDKTWDNMMLGQIGIK